MTSETASLNQDSALTKQGHGHGLTSSSWYLGQREQLPQGHAVSAKITQNCKTEPDIDLRQHHIC